MLRLDDYADPSGTQRFHQGIGDLHGEILLNLQAAREDVRLARDFL